MTTKEASFTETLNAEAAVLKKRWSEQLKTVGESDDAKDSPTLAKRLTVAGNCWGDCAEVEALNAACAKGITGLKGDSAICQAATRYFALCKERDEWCQDPTEH
uniref:Uncharacterized protein n=1 Tax=Minutocellus polymorphus TaxID=265543 RepID=A0A7S0AY15_9STRA|mmetsp:Transcript_6304/g.10517  ORF Transcript_6304/g.10517 Transcript_6304/m.10517 type:complete len:104 (+) Transcript_6304:67-378(+)|eukprot:CAMPEP_0197722490 /NCGR_PEP_ID=MMETSP1434-20131217/5167_1 /TAXON_ID=265543 /ORGANISM="Minutocellus polymorphus, Strain CCMP3303" /LENGTH=103 /DNA_ID=CAMNT_0043307657 /DNA_START=33 /DNA_END=344 /DNA_ORIENTATION=-